MQTPQLRPRIRIGPAGWSYPDWEGVVYPAHKPRGFHAAAYLAHFFDTIEINTSFYHPPEAKVVRDWVRRVADRPDFKFTTKLWQRFTHERDAGREDEKTFKQSIAPLMESGRLGALLLQFPWSFKNTKESREYLGGLVMQFMEFPMVVEVRHSSWNKPEILEMLRNLGVGFCNIDQPVIGRSIAPSDYAIAQSGVGYIRLHGHNYEQWFSSGKHPEERYNYLYSLEELGPWAERIKNVAAQTAAVFVITNNHFGGKAIANALQLIRLVTGKDVRVPEDMLAHFPELAAIAAPGITSLPLHGESAQGEALQPGLLFDNVNTKTV